MKFPKSAANAISICFDNPFLSKDVTKTFSQRGTHKPKKENMRSVISALSLIMTIWNQVRDF